VIANHTAAARRVYGRRPRRPELREHRLRHVAEAQGLRLLGLRDGWLLADGPIICGQYWSLTALERDLAWAELLGC
jgi:hypothetical protein